MRGAEQLYRRVLQAEPKHFGALHALGLLRAQRDDNDEAIALLGQAIAQNPRSAETHLNLAVVYETLCRPEQALTLCARALAIRPHFAEAHFTAGNALKALNRFEEAVVHFRNAIFLRSDYVEAYYNLGNIYFAFRNYETAKEQYDKALGLRPQYPKARNNRGVLLQELGSHGAALRDFEKALAHKPDYFEALINQGNTLLALARPDEALVSFDMALSLRPDRGEQLYGRGVAIRQGDVVHDSSDVWAYGASLAIYGKAFATRARDLSGSTRLMEEALRRFIAAGVPATQQAPPSPRYPSAMYPDALRAVMRCLDAAGIEAFLTGGTLLGAIRNGDFLDFDKDLDFGVPANVTKTDLWRALSRDPNFNLSDDYEDDALLVSCFWRDKVAIDFFRFFAEGDHLWCGLYISGSHLMKWVHSPFDLVDFRWHDVSVKIPADSDRFLTEAYGDWRTPNPYFGLFASPNIEGGFLPVSRNIAYSAIYAALWRRDRPKAMELCRQVLALDPGDTLIAALRGTLAKLSAGETAGSSPLLPSGLGEAFDDLPG